MVRWTLTRGMVSVFTLPACRLIDNLPSATAYTSQQGAKKKQYEPGFKLGTWKEDKAYIHNHVNLKLYYASRVPGSPTSEKYIVGFEVYPKRCVKWRCELL